MAKREIADWQGRSIGASIARYVWRSKPTRSPVTDRPVRCIVAQDEKGQYWAATRTGRGNGKKAQYEFWERCDTQQHAMEVSRQQARILLGTHAELYSNTVKDKKPGEKIVEITMDDGWSVAITAPQKPVPPSPAFVRAMKLFDEFGGNRKPPQKSRPRGRSIDR